MARTRIPLQGQADLRWQRADEPRPQGALFEEVQREVGRGEFRGMEFLHVRAQKIINELKGGPAYLPFQHTINAYRGCSHACSYCVGGDTPILMADGRAKPMSEVRTGDVVYGTVRRGTYRRYTPSRVLDHWSTDRTAYRILLADGTTLIASRDHRFLTNRGWKHVAGSESGADCRPHLTAANSMLGMGRLAEPPKQDDEYRRGYLCGMIRGDGTIGSCRYEREGRAWEKHGFRLALVDAEGLDRSAAFLQHFGVPTTRQLFTAATSSRAEVQSIRIQRRDAVNRMRGLIEWPDRPSEAWSKGFLAGIFDAEGSSSCGVFRIANSDPEMISRTVNALDRFGFRSVVEEPSPNSTSGVRNVRLLGGLRERMRFFVSTDVAITRKRTIDGVALKSDADLRVVSVESLGVVVPMYDITTETGDFIADGVVSHNCFARPTHEYLGLDIGRDFEQRIVVKVNAAERLEAELRPSRWAGHLIAMGTNTDPYQRCEGKYRLTRSLVEVLAEHRNPFSILTKSTLILRDLDLLAAAAQVTSVRANLSIGTLDEDVWRLTEPGTPSPASRLRAVAALNAAGVSCGVLIGPVLPGLSDRRDQLEAVATAAVEAGATSVSSVLLHLRGSVKEHYLGKLALTRPDLVERLRIMYPGSNAPKADRQRASRIVQEAVRRAGGAAAGPMAPIHLVGRPAPDPAASAPPAEQLGFGF